MSIRLEKELDKVKFSLIYQLEEGHYQIKKETQIRLEVDGIYLIRLKDEVFNSNSVITTNWNNNRIPLSRYYQVEIQSTMVNMIKVVGVGFDDESCQIPKDNWFGWFSKDEIEVLKKL